LKPKPTSPKATSAAIHPAKVELRVLGTTVTLQEHIRKQAEQDLGIKLRFIVDDGSAVQRAGHRQSML
jgi:putative spermidine/putrescine transport system substrate-binding protein